MDDSSIVYVDEHISDQEEIQQANIDVAEMQPTSSAGYLLAASEGVGTEQEGNEILPEATLAAIVSNQLLMHNNQLKIMASLAQLTTSVEILAKRVLSIEKHLEAEPLTTTAADVFKTVESLGDLNSLEAELKDETRMKHYVEILSTICGKTGKSDGIDCAYRLIDYMASRDMINMCSWTGLSRDAAEPSESNEFEAGPSKIPLKFYSKFRELFFRVLRLADQDFSEASCEKFLKGIMKNSKQRLTSKFMSTHKNRPKNLKYGAKKSEEDSNLK